MKSSMQIKNEHRETLTPSTRYYNLEPCGDPDCHVLITHPFEEALLTVDALPNPGIAGPFGERST